MVVGAVAGNATCVSIRDIPVTRNSHEVVDPPLDLRDWMVAPKVIRLVLFGIKFQLQLFATSQSRAKAKELAGGHQLLRDPG